MSRHVNPTIAYVLFSIPSYSSGCAMLVYMAGNTAWPAKTNASKPKDTGRVLRCSNAVDSNPVRVEQNRTRQYLIAHTYEN